MKWPFAGSPQAVNKFLEESDAHKNDHQDNNPQARDHCGQGGEVSGRS